MRALMAFVGLLLTACVSTASAQEGCDTEETVIQVMQDMGAQLGDRLSGHDEIAAFTDHFPPPTPEMHIDDMTVAQIWIKHEWAFVVFFDAHGCAKTTGETDADEALKASGNAKL